MLKIKKTLREKVKTFARGVSLKLFVNKKCKEQEVCAQTDGKGNLFLLYPYIDPFPPKTHTNVQSTPNKNPLHLAFGG